MSADVGAARSAAAGWLREAGTPADQSDSVVMVVSELVTNAVRHAQTAFEVRLARVDDGLVRVAVFDLDTRHPHHARADVEATGGRGLHIVDALSEDWGSISEERNGIHGKTVWADIR